MDKLVVWINKLWASLILLLISLTCLVLAMTPIWLFLVAKAIAKHEGFWQGINIIALKLGVLFLGGLQAVLMIYFFVWMVSVWKVFLKEYLL